ncbi:MAG TPA: methylated-DNA--[protein]-cysteine S-methyltransferase [Candidatus Sulfotelmatobacter sp.]|nr:methylated-DNA--[protein]-cysteine S-methyltransferase [Candidatus Sulfotelmatobacter sp.]
MLVVMTGPGFTIFETAIGSCGLAWNARGIVAVQLPEPTAGATRARLAHRVPGAQESPPPPHVRRAADGITALLRGEPADLTAVPLDVEAIPPFDRDVYAIARTVPAGATITYGQIATRLGELSLSRDVGAALGRNPFPLVVPCHRVLAAGGKDGGFSARGGIATKRTLLRIEGALPPEPPSLFDPPA